MSHQFHIQVFKKSGALVYTGEITKFPYTIGRSPENDLVLPFEEISRKQFVIDFDEADAVLKLESLGQKNAAEIGGRPFQSTREPISHELRLSIGSFEFRVLHHAAEMAETRIFDLSSIDPTFENSSDISSRMHGAFRVVQRNFKTRPARSIGITGGVLVLMAMLGYLVSGGKSQALSEAQLITEIQEGVFEVVYPKQEDAFVVYEKPLPVEKLPFKDRIDKFTSIGTAFYIGDGLFASAAHVFEPDQKKPLTEFSLRNSKGETVKVSDIVKLSGHKDLIVFKTESMFKDVKELKLQKVSKVGEAVYTAGNAHGEGLALRSGVVSSYTPENLDGAWRYIRYSAPASPGNSGGPLLNAFGEVVGVVVMKSQGENLNFAVPVELLESLPTDRAEFVYDGAAEIESGFRLNADRWNLNQPLPAKLSDLTQKAAEALDQQYFSHRKKFEETYGDKIYPKDPALEGYLVEAKLSSGASFMEIDRDKAGKWTSSEVEGQYRDLKVRGSLWYDVSKDSYGSRVMAAYYFPKTDSITQYWNEPKKVMDLFLNELEWSRTFAGERILIKSYGEPHTTEAWEDGLGRKWVTWIWRTTFDQMSHVVSCLPFPKTLACRWSYTAQNYEGVARYYEKVEAARKLRSFYSGSYKQWKAFLELGDAWVPKFVRNLDLKLSEGSGYAFQIAFGDKSWTFKHEVADDNEFSVGFMWNPIKPAELELRQVSFYENTNIGDFGHNYVLYHSARSDGSSSYSELWRKIAFEAAPYDGQITQQGDNFLSTKTVKRLQVSVADEVNPTLVAWVGNCLVSTFLPQEKRREFMARCRSAWEQKGQSIRQPASVGAPNSAKGSAAAAKKKPK